MDIEGLVGDEYTVAVGIAASAVCHDFSLIEPNEAARGKIAPVGHEGALEDIHAVTAMVSMSRSNGAPGIPYVFYRHPGIFVFDEVLLKVVLPVFLLT